MRFKRLVNNPFKGSNNEDNGGDDDDDFADDYHNDDDYDDYDGNAECRILAWGRCH